MASNIELEGMALSMRESMTWKPSELSGKPSILPLPNPPFVFPMHPTSPEDKQSGAFGDGQRSSRSRPHRLSISSVPIYEFPSGSSSSSTPTSGEFRNTSPSRASLGPPRSSGHRRERSEFIGGHGSLHLSGLRSASPSKIADSLPTSPAAGRGPPPGRRGHAHRRSAAISNHDVSTILRPAHELRSDSAPTSPCDPSPHRQFLLSTNSASALPTPEAMPTPSSPPPPLPRRELATPAGQSRPRVGFSDTLEFIPRPLSTISSETSSSLSTIRAAHSVTGSISSILSMNSPPPKKVEPMFETPPKLDAISRRPLSAGLLRRQSPTSLLGNQVEPTKRPASAHAFPRVTFKEEVYRSRSQECLPTRASASSKSREFGRATADQPQALEEFSPHQVKCAQGRSLPISRPRSSPEIGIAKQQKKSRSWFRRQKAQVPESMALAMDSSEEFASPDDFALEDVNFDDDTTCVIHSPQYPPYSGISPAIPAFSASQRHGLDPDPEPSTVLDLDAWAFEPETPGIEKSSPQGLPQRRLHSSGTTGAFVGPGMHYHRRAESAPAMSPVDYSTSAFSRMGSNAMADVFEEEEEDEGHLRHESHAGPNLTGLGVEILDTETTSSSSSSVGSFHDENPPSTPTARGLRAASSTRGSPLSALTAGDGLPVAPSLLPPAYEMSDGLATNPDEPRFSLLTKSSDDSTITPTISPRALASEPSLEVIDFSNPRTTLYDDRGTTSSVSSPSFADISFDAPRLHTATSSITDRTTWSSSKPSEAPRWASSEDVPSLSSSASTMFSGGHPRFSSSADTRSSGERAHSLSAALPRTARPTSASKRASFASLSRLVGTSYGERSKLSIESRVDDSEAKEKKRGNRMSRLMRFWKSKEKVLG